MLTLTKHLISPLVLREINVELSCISAQFLVLQLAKCTFQLKFQYGLMVLIIVCPILSVAENESTDCCLILITHSR